MYLQLNLIGPHWYDGFLSRAIQHHLGYLSSFGNFRRGKSRRSERSALNLRGSTRSTKNTAVNSSKSCKGGSDSSQGDCPLGSSHINNGSIFENEVCKILNLFLPVLCMERYDINRCVSEVQSLKTPVLQGTVHYNKECVLYVFAFIFHIIPKN